MSDLSDIQNKQLVICYIGFDGYSDLWDDCFMLMNRFWGDRPYETVFVNNTKSVAYENVFVYHAGKTAEWSKKVQVALQMTRGPYICLLLEDFYVGSAIDTQKIEEAIRLMERDGLRYYRLANLSRFGKNRNSQYRDIPYLHVIMADDRYGVSLQPAIWKRDYLEELVGKDNYNAWMFEFDRVRESEGQDNVPREGCVDDDRNMLNLVHTVLQSSFLPAARKYFNSIGISPTNRRAELKGRKYVKYLALRIIYAYLPKFMHTTTKSLMERLGVKFVSTTRDIGRENKQSGK